MALEIGSSYLNGVVGSSLSANNKTNQLESALNNKNVSDATDEELMDVCKSFEAYFVEQVFKEMKSTVHSSDDNGEYMKYFGDMMIQSYAEEAADSGAFGIAQMLYESMKRQ